MAGASTEVGLSVLGDIAQGTHFCLFYETKEDLLDTVVPYFKAGLERKEFCIWAISEPLSEDDARDTLSRAIRGFDRHLANGSIEIVPGHEWYLEGDRFDLMRVTAGWKEKLRSALARGHSAMRISGNAFWLGTDYWKDFQKYELDLQESIAGQPMSVLCTYPLTASLAADVLEVAHAHQFAVAIRKGDWKFIETAKAGMQVNPLTPREREVLAWVSRGKSAWEIGQILHITKRTVDEHVQKAVRKLGAVNRTHAVAIALRDRLIDRDITAIVDAGRNREAC